MLPLPAKRVVRLADETAKLAEQIHHPGICSPGNLRGLLAVQIQSTARLYTVQQTRHLTCPVSGLCESWFKPRLECRRQLSHAHRRPIHDFLRPKATGQSADQRAVTMVFHELQISQVVDQVGRGHDADQLIPFDNWQGMKTVGPH